MKYYISNIIQRIGFDFYCDVANNIIKARKEKDWTQEDLAKKAKLSKGRLSQIESAKTRVELADLEKLAPALEKSIDWLIDADFDSPLGECLYLVWADNAPDVKLYQKATSAQMAALTMYQRLRDSHVRLENGRVRLLVQLVGIPTDTKMIKKSFPSCISNAEITLDMD